MVQSHVVFKPQTDLNKHIKAVFMLSISKIQNLIMKFQSLGMVSMTVEMNIGLVETRGEHTGVNMDSLNFQLVPKLTLVLKLTVLLVFLLIKSILRPNLFSDYQILN